jgi:hypothetical protein
MALFDNCVASWKLDDLTDATGRGNTLTNNNTVTFNTGKLGNAAYFDGASSQYLSRTSSADLELGDIDFTIGFWFYIAAADIGRTMMLLNKSADGAGNSEYDIYYFGPSDGLIHCQVYRPTDSFVAVLEDTAPSADTWHCLMFWHNAATDEIGVSMDNGTAVIQATGGSLQAASNSPFTLGKLSTSTGPLHLYGRKIT